VKNPFLGTQRVNSRLLIPQMHFIESRVAKCSLSHVASVRFQAINSVQPIAANGRLPPPPPVMILCADSHLSPRRLQRPAARALLSRFSGFDTGHTSCTYPLSVLTRLSRTKL
jgi:hypothetical protein